MKRRAVVYGLIPAIAAALGLSEVLLWGAVGGSISGKTTDASGMTVAGVRISVTSTAQGIATKTTSDHNGAYRFPILAVGRYDLQAEAPGFKPQSRKGIVLHVDDVLRVDLMLEAETK
jgi:hypothetical protein